MQQALIAQGSRGTGAFHVENTPATHSASVDRVNEAQAKLAFACPRRVQPFNANLLWMGRGKN